MLNLELKIRPIRPEDNQDICRIIKSNLIEFNAAIKGTAYYDKETEAMYEAYQDAGSQYVVALLNQKIVGGCGIKALNAYDQSYCELQKMYMLPQARGLKIGKKLILTSLEFAIKSKYHYCYIETFPHMKAAIKLYLKNGFKKINHPLGNTNHYACNTWLLKDLKL